MAGPKMIGIKDVINPYEGLQESVSRVGDIYQNYEKERRDSQLYAKQMAEYERKENARQYLNNYTPEFGGADFRGIDAETKKAMILEEGNILKNLAETGADPEEYKRVTSEFAIRRKQLVTREAVTADVYNDLIRNHVDPAIAQNLAAIEGSKYESLEERFKNASAAAAAEREEVFKRAQIAIDSYEARNPRRSSAKPGTSERGLTPLTTSSGVLTYLQDRISGPGFKIDANKAFEDINSAVDLINKDRAEKGEKQIALGDITPLIATSFVSSMGDNDVIYGDSGTWRQAIEKYIAANGTGDSQGISPATAAEQAAITAALTAAKTDPNSRAEFFAKRVRSTYGDLYKNLKNTKVGDDGKVVVLGGTGNSAAGGGRVPSTNPGAGNGSRVDGAIGTPESGDASSTVTPGGGAPVEAPTPETPSPAEPAVVKYPANLVTERADIQSRIDKMRGEAGTVRSAADAHTLGVLQSRLAGVEEKEAAFRRELASPEITAAYNAAVAAGVGKNIPEELFSFTMGLEVDKYPADQLEKLSKDITAEIANYNAVSEYSLLKGNRWDASKAGVKIKQLQNIATLVNERLGKERLASAEKRASQEAASRVQQSTPRVAAAYNESLKRMVGANIPEDLYSQRTAPILDEYSADQLQQLGPAVASELANYRAAWQHANMTGDKATAIEAKYKMDRLQYIADYIDQKLGSARLPQ